MFVGWKTQCGQILLTPLRSGVLKCPLPYGNGQGDPRWLEKAGAWGPQGRLVLGVNTKVQGRGCDRLAEPMAGESRAGWLGPGWGPGSLIHSVGKEASSRAC